MALVRAAKHQGEGTSFWGKGQTRLGVNAPWLGEGKGTKGVTLGGITYPYSDPEFTSRRAQQPQLGQGEVPVNSIPWKAPVLEWLGITADR